MQLQAKIVQATTEQTVNFLTYKRLSA